VRNREKGGGEEDGGRLGDERGRNIESFPAAPARANIPAAGCSG